MLSILACSRRKIVDWEAEPQFWFVTLRVDRLFCLFSAKKGGKSNFKLVIVGVYLYCYKMKTETALLLEIRIKHLFKNRKLLWCPAEARRNLMEFKKLRIQLEEVRAA